MDSVIFKGGDFMDNVIFTADNLEVVGVNRSVLPFQVSVDIPTGFNPSKLVQVEAGIHHKRDELGRKLFLDGEEEVPFDSKVVEFEEIETTRTIILENGDKVTQEVTDRMPLRFEQLKPIYVPYYTNTLVSLRENPTVFTYSDIIEAKQEVLAEQYSKRFIYFNEDMAEESFSTSLASFTADLGLGIAILHGRGQLRTNKIPLPTGTTHIEIYAEVQKDVDVEFGFTASEFVKAEGEIEVPSGAKDVYIRFINKCTHKREIKAFGILV